MGEMTNAQVTALAAAGSHTHTEADLSLSDNTTANASTTAHGLVVKATAPASGLMNVVGIGNGETAYTNKPLFDTTNPAALGTAGPGSQVIAARRDHVHANPAIDTLAAATDITTLNATSSAHGLLPKLSNTVTEFLNGQGGWTTPPSLQPNFMQVAGVGGAERSYIPGVNAGAGGSGTGTPQAADLIGLWPFVPPVTMTITKLRVRVSSLGAGSLCRVGIYANTSGSNLTPGSLIVDGGELDLSTTGVKTLTISQALTAGTLYWIGAVFNNTNPTLETWADAACWPILGVVGTTNAQVFPGVGWKATHAYAALPSSLSSPTVMVSGDLFAGALSVRVYPGS